nr:hydroxyacylglutathione hydrolase [Pararhodospirillum photometricum]
METLDIAIIPLRADNYAYLLRCRATGQGAVIDPGAGAPVLAHARALGWPLHQILLTHHHADHTDGVEEIHDTTECAVLGAALDRARLPPLTHGLADGDRVHVGAVEGVALATPGHTHGHLAFHFPAAGVVFTGDCLFTMGCGRVFEGTAAQMWASLARLRALDPDTLVYCGHDYAEGNVRFALALEPASPALNAHAADLKARRTRGQPSVPSRLADERALNPFFARR